jgi:hypothetical protein
MACCCAIPNWVRRCWYTAAVAAGVGQLIDIEGSGLVAEGVDVKTAPTMLGHSEARLTLDVYAEAVAKLGEAAAEAMGARFLGPARDRRAMDARWRPVQGGRPNDGRSATWRLTCASAVEPEKGIEPLTYALRVRCSAV